MRTARLLLVVQLSLTVVGLLGLTATLFLLYGTQTTQARQIAALSREVASLKGHDGKLWSQGVLAGERLTPSLANGPWSTEGITIIPKFGQKQDDFAALDPSGIPVCWIDSGSSDGVGGMECASDSHVAGDGYVSAGTDVYHRDASLTPAATLVLAPCGKQSCAVTLTARKLRQLLRLVK